MKHFPYKFEYAAPKAIIDEVKIISIKAFND